MSTESDELGYHHAMFHPANCGNGMRHYWQGQALRAFSMARKGLRAARAALAAALAAFPTGLAS